MPYDRQERWHFLEWAACACIDCACRHWRELPAPYPVRSTHGKVHFKAGGDMASWYPTVNYGVLVTYFCPWKERGNGKRKIKSVGKGKDKKVGVGREGTDHSRASSQRCCFAWETATVTNSIRPLQQRRPSIHCDLQLIQRCDDPFPSCQSFRVASTPRAVVARPSLHSPSSSAACMPLLCVLSGSATVRRPKNR